jgi:type IV pilus assembly protein PilY1
MNDAMQNGVASPALVLGSDGAVRFAYAGDLQGNLWRFNFEDVAPWADALGSAPHKPLFTATDAKNNRQPITSQPKVVYAPGGGYVVLFGTGKFVEEADAAPGAFNTQSFYGIYDTTMASYSVADRSELVARWPVKVMQKSGNAIDNDVIEMSGDAFVYSAAADGKKGWYFDLAASDKTGERIVTNAVTAYGRLFFNSLIPGSDPCVGNTGRSYLLDTLTGLPFGGKATGYLSEVGMLSTPLLFETDVAVGDRDPIGKRLVKKKYGIFNPGTGGTKGAIAPVKQESTEIMTPAGRFSWREVINWQELRDAINKK